MKKEKLTRRERAKIVDECLKLVYDSLKSHLGYTHSKIKGNKVFGSTSFQKKTVKEYAWLMFLISRLY